MTLYLQVKFHRGIEILSILKNYVPNTSILDDFDFYESRQKVIQEKRIRHSTLDCNLQVCHHFSTTFSVFSLLLTLCGYEWILNTFFIIFLFLFIHLFFRK